MCINIIDARETTTSISNIKNIRESVKVIPREIPWENISDFLAELFYLALMAGYGGYYIAFFGLFLQKIGFEIIGYRLFAFGFRFFVTSFSIATLSNILRMFIDRFFISEEVNFHEMTIHNYFLNQSFIDYNGGMLS